MSAAWKICRDKEKISSQRDGSINFIKNTKCFEVQRQKCAHIYFGAMFNSAKLEF